MKWMKDLDKDDIDTLQELGSLSTVQLMEKVKDLINLAYQSKNVIIKCSFILI